MEVGNVTRIGSLSRGTTLNDGVSSLFFSPFLVLLLCCFGVCSGYLLGCRVHFAEDYNGNGLPCCASMVSLYDMWKFKLLHLHFFFNLRPRY
jgi:hypothetical protein